MPAFLQTLSVRLWRAGGIAPNLSWPDRLLSLMFRQAPWTTVAGWRAWFIASFPHVNPARWRAGDVIRVPLQLLWLCLVRPLPPVQGEGLQRSKESWGHSWRSGLLPRLRSWRAAAGL